MFVERMRFVKALDQPRDEETIGGFILCSAFYFIIAFVVKGERMSKKNQQAKNFESFNTSIPNLTGFWLAIRDTSSNVPFFVYSKHFLCLIIHFEKNKQMKDERLYLRIEIPYASTKNGPSKIDKSFDRNVA